MHSSTPGMGVTCTAGGSHALQGAHMHSRDGGHMHCRGLTCTPGMGVTCTAGVMHYRDRRGSTHCRGHALQGAHIAGVMCCGGGGGGTAHVYRRQRTHYRDHALQGAHTTGVSHSSSSCFVTCTTGKASNFSFLVGGGPSSSRLANIWLMMFSKPWGPQA